MIHINEREGLIRFFSDGRQYGEAYKAIVNVFWVTANTVKLYGLLGLITKQDVVDLKQSLKLLGVKYILAQRQAKRTLPFSYYCNRGPLKGMHIIKIY